MSGAIARLTVTWFVLTGGWDPPPSSRRDDLIAVRLASWLWPPMLWRVEGRVPPTATAVLLELQGLGLVRVEGRDGNDLLVRLLKVYGLPEKLLAEIDALVAKRDAGEEDAHA